MRRRGGGSLFLDMTQATVSVPNDLMDLSDRIRSIGAADGRKPRRARRPKLEPARR
jgi:hypothetical protein